MHSVFLLQTCSDWNIQSVSSSAHHTCGELLAHTTSLFAQEKHTHTYANTAHGRFLQLSCLSLSLQTSRNPNLFWYCCFDTFILKLVDMRQLELDMPLPKSDESLWPTMFSLAFWQRFWNCCWPVRACISKWYA